MLAAGFDTYLLDWGEATPVDFSGGLSGLVAESFSTVAKVIRARSEMPHFHLLGYCLGGTLAAIFTALEPALIKDLVLMAAPIDCGAESSLLKSWSEEERLDVDALVGAYGNCPGALLRNCFALLKPVRNFYAKFGELADRLDDDEFVDSFVALERWARTGVSVPGSVFRDVVKLLYQRNDLVSGQLEIDGRRVRLDRIGCPVLLLTATEDHLVSPRSTLGLVSRICSRDVKLMSLQGGHESLAVSSTAHTTFWPEVAQWLADHSVPRTGPRIQPGDDVVDRPPVYGHGSIHDQLTQFPRN
jgi:polyhydroxyalkanoate synthase